MVYALKDRKYFQFQCISGTKEGMERKIQDAYCNWRSLKARDATEKERSMETYLSAFIKVSIEINRLKEGE